MSDAADDTPPFLAPFWWNYQMETGSIGKVMGCLNTGWYGLFFLNDNGEMMAKCFDLFGWDVKAKYDEPIAA